MINTLPLKKASIKSLYKKAPVKKNRIKKARIKKAAAMGGLSHGSVRFCRAGTFLLRKLNQL